MQVTHGRFIRRRQLAELRPREREDCASKAFLAPYIDAFRTPLRDVLANDTTNGGPTSYASTASVIGAGGGGGGTWPNPREHPRRHLHQGVVSDRSRQPHNQHDRDPLMLYPSRSNAPSHRSS